MLHLYIGQSPTSSAFSGVDIQTIAAGERPYQGSDEDYSVTDHADNNNPNNSYDDNFFAIPLAGGTIADSTFFGDQAGWLFVETYDA